MKTVVNHLGQIILSVAAIALVVGITLTFGGTIAGFFGGVTDNLTNLATGEIWNIGGTTGNETPGESTSTLEGSGQEFYNWEPTDLTFRSLAPLNEFQDLKIDGETVDPQYYTLTSGSTIVTLSAEYLQTLNRAKYSISVISENSTATGEFTVVFEPGLYGTDGSFVTWEQLLTDGTLAVENGVLYSAYDEDADENPSADVLVGNLVLPNDGSVSEIGDLAFVLCSSLQGIAISPSVTTIGEYAFASCQSLESIIIPASVELIGDYCFSDSKGLKEIHVATNNTNYKSIDGNLYTEDGTTLLIYAPGKTDTSFVVPDTVTTISDYTFCGCTSLTSVTITDSVTFIGLNAFQSCKGITSITFGENSQLTTIGTAAFYDCKSLTNITIPDGVTSIGDYAFTQCTSLESINYGGTMEQWNTLTFGINWNGSVPARTVTCSNGTVTLK